MLNRASVLITADSMVIISESRKLVLRLVHKISCKFCFLPAHNTKGFTPVHFGFIINRKLHFLALTYTFL